MKKILLLFLVLILSGSLLFINKNDSHKANEKSADLRQKHENFLRNSPFKETLKMSKEERKGLGLPPNKYAERQWELTMNPETGKPEPEKLFKLQQELSQRALFSKVPGENTNNWVERGPNNVGGRTRAIMFDPNDSTNKKVFAGGVSGGLWVNNDITDANSSWSLVNMPENLAVSCITYDPNNTNTFYVGTGESYVQGTINGNGLWKSTDAGNNWSRVLGGATANGEGAKVIVNSPAGIAGDYAAIQASFGEPLTKITGNLVLVDDGTARASTLGCNPLVNSGEIAGNIAVIERGTCSFDIKVKNAENAGAIAVLVVNNVAGAPIIMGGDDYTIYIPALMVSQADGQAIIAELGNTVNVTIEPDVIPANAALSANSGIQHINDVVVRDNGGVSEVYVAAAASAFIPSSSSGQLGFFGTSAYGLYKSSDNGATFELLTLPINGSNSAIQPNDIEIGADNKVWISTTRSFVSPSDPGGQVLSSADGITFTLETTVANGRRTEIAVSKTDSNKIYVLAELTSGTNAVEIISTDDGFANQTSLPLPNDADTGIPETDFTRGQAFYDLVIEVDPTDDNIVYTGGIDLFKTTDGGSTWNQISKWSNNNALAGLNVSYVHADQHAMAFGNNSASTVMFSHDGGISYSSDAGTTISERTKDYSTIQFYKGALGPDVSPNERILGGSQDNGNLESGVSTIPGANSFSDIWSGGDGAYVFIDRDKKYMITSYVYNNYQYQDYNNPTGQISVYDIVEDENSGDFINPAELDDINDILYTNGTSGTTYQINRYILNIRGATASNFTNVLLDANPTAFKASENPSTTLFIGTENGKLFKVEGADSAPVWREITGNDFFGSISSIQLGASEMEIYVTFYNYGVQSIFYSQDGGASWRNKEGNFPDIPVRAIMANPLNSNEVIIGTDLGVWGTADFSATNPNWVRSQNGMKDVIITSFDLRTVDNTVLASTYGRGMFTGKFTADASTLSVENIDFNNAIKVYPTISNGNFKVAASKEINNGILNIYDLNGREVYASKIDFNRSRIQNISLNTSSGMYIVKFKSDNKVSTYKIVIK